MRDSIAVVRRVFTLTVLLAGGLVSQQQTQVVRPKEISGFLVNPGIGIQTFQRFQGQTLYPTQHWSEAGPTQAVADPATPADFPASSVAYLRWFWSELEPQPGKYRWDIIDSALDEARKHGQTLQIRMMPYDQQHPLPEWYQQSGAGRANKPADSDGKIWSPDADDPAYARDWGKLVAAAGARYDGHPYLEAVDVSTVGYWGEGWGPYLPDWSVQQKLIDQYLAAFHRTPLQMNFDELDALVYGTKHGAGWRLDCWGDMGRPGKGFAHMFDLYPEQVARAHIEDVWRTAPVSLETCGTPGTWKQWGFDLKPIFDQALRWHASTVNLKSTPLPEGYRKEFEEFATKLGYRFVLRRFEYPKIVRAGTMMPVRMWWFNGGVAPVYRDYTLALEIGGAVTRLPADVRTWLPGDAVFEQSVYVDEHANSGRQRVRVALLDPRTQKPAIQLAIEGRQPDGWYDVGEIEVQR